MKWFVVHVDSCFDPEIHTTKEDALKSIKLWIESDEANLDDIMLIEGVELSLKLKMEVVIK